MVSKLQLYGVVILLCLVCFLGVKNEKLRQEVSSLETSILQREKDSALALKEAENKMKDIEIKYQNEINKLRKTQEERYENLLAQHNNTIAALDRLQSTTSQIRSKVYDPNVSRETLVHYVDRYSEVFQQCSAELSTMGLDADKLVLRNQELVEFIDVLYKILKEYEVHNQEVDQLVGTTP